MRRQDVARAALHMGPPCALLEKGRTKTTICLKAATSFQALYPICPFSPCLYILYFVSSRRHNLSIFLVIYILQIILIKYNITNNFQENLLLKFDIL